MHLAYLDDSQQSGTLAMFGAVLIPHGEFGYAERLHSAAIEQMFRPEEIEEKFQEFHARDLFKGDGIFKGIEEEKRFNAIRMLLSAMRNNGMPFIYAAIDTCKLAKSALAQSLFEVADSLIPAFKLCALGVERWAQTHHPQPSENGILIDYKDQYLFIVDDTTDPVIKKGLKRSYRMLRTNRPYLNGNQTRLWHCHDAMYFGDSAESVGIQLADLCTYFMQRRLTKRNPDAKDKGDEFFEMFSHLAICAKPEPEWTQYAEFLMDHGGRQILRKTNPIKTIFAFVSPWLYTGFLWTFSWLRLISLRGISLGLSTNESRVWLPGSRGNRGERSAKRAVISGRAGGNLGRRIGWRRGLLCRRCRGLV